MTDLSHRDYIDNLLKRIAELEEERDELKAFLIQRERFYNERLDLKKAERDRLREALQEIANKELSGWATRTGLPPYDVQSCINIAKIALKEIDK